jgi:hypothetical protein
MGAAMALAGVLLGATACDDDKPPEEGQISEQAQKGLDIAPFQLDVTGLSKAEKEKLGLGSYLVNSVGGCTDCHNTPAPDGSAKYLSGGVGFPIGASGELVYGRNLTPDADTGMKLTEAEFLEAMRTGKDYKSDNAEELLFVMPWFNYRWMSTDDLKAIYAYLQKVPAVRNPVPADIKGAAAALRPVPLPASYNEGAVTRTLPAEGSADPINSTRGLAIQPLADPSGLASLSAEERARYGRGSYLVNAVAGCSDCHTNPARNFSPGPDFIRVNTGQFMTGGSVFALPPGLDAALKVTRSMGANLLGAEHGAMGKRYQSYEEFRKAITQGDVTENGVTRKLTFPMSFAVANYSKMLDSDLQAIYSYLKTQATVQGAADKQTQPPARWCTGQADCAASETCNTATNECVGGSCTQASQCGACQVCSEGKCAAPEASSMCLQSGI